MKIGAASEHFAWFWTREEPSEWAERLDDAARIARAIAQRMDPEWREFVDEEQLEKRRIASSDLTTAKPVS